ncbi:MAG: hypothetical protein QM767_08830 [Anaeromyxobacter sp.]
MEPWIRCAGCGLNHHPRPDGQCPRCHAQLAPPPLGAAAPPPLAAAPAAPQGWGPGAAPPPPPQAPLPGAPPGGGWGAGSAAARNVLDVGATLSLILRQFGQGVGPLVALGAVAVLPMAIYALSIDPLAQPRPSAGDPFAPLRALAGPLTYMMLGSALLSPLAGGAITALVTQQLQGGPASPGPALQLAVRRYLPLLAAEALLGLAIMGTCCTVVVPAILGCGWVAVRPAVVLEGRGPWNGFSRSWALTRGHRMTIFAVVLVLMLALWGIGSVTGIVQSVMQARALALDEPVGLGFRAVQVVSVALNAVQTALLGVAPPVIYRRLRELNGEQDAGQLAQVFE